MNHASPYLNHASPYGANACRYRCPPSSERSTSMQPSASALCMCLECAFKCILLCRFAAPHHLTGGHGWPCCRLRQHFQPTQQLQCISQTQCSCPMLALVITVMCGSASAVQYSSSRKMWHDSFCQRDSHFPPTQKREARRRFTKVLFTGLGASAPPPEPCSCYN